MLMDLASLQWDAGIAAEMGIPMTMLPEIRSSSAVLGEGRAEGSLAGVPIAGVLGDQQAAMFGQACLQPGEAKNTYGTGNFMLLNTGTDADPVGERAAHHGLLPDRRRAGDLRAGGVDRGDRIARPVVPRQPRDDLRCVGDRGSGTKCRRQRRRLHRAGVLRIVRALLAQRRPRGDRRADPVRHQGAPRQGGAGGDGVPDPRGAGRDERRRGFVAATSSRWTAA